MGVVYSTGNIFLIGMPGCGKSSVGRALATLRQATFIDLDAELVRRTGVDIATIFDIEGESGFRARESAALADVSSQQSIVLSTGGGTVLHKKNRLLLRDRGMVVYLQTSLELLWHRLSHSSRIRPLLNVPNPKETLTRLYEERTPLYEICAHLTFISSTAPETDVANRLNTRLQQLSCNCLESHEP